MCYSVVTIYKSNISISGTFKIVLVLIQAPILTVVRNFVVMSRGKKHANMNPNDHRVSIQ